MTDSLVRALAFGENVRIVVAVTTELVGEAMRVHDTGPVAAAALGRLLTATLLLGASAKADERLTLQAQGGGPLGLVLARTAGTGRVYGTVANPHADLPARPDGKLDVGGGVGTDGNLVVVRDLGFGEPYVGMVPLATGEIGDDVAQYLSQSEQLLSAVGVGVRLATDARCLGAGGFLVQVLGGCTDEEFDAVEARISTLRELSATIEAGATAEDLLAMLAPDARVLETIGVGYDCPLDRDYYAKRLQGLGVHPLEDLFSTHDELEVVCEFSRRAYVFRREELLG